jgi:hypothetical protein
LRLAKKWLVLKAWHSNRGRFDFVCVTMKELEAPCRKLKEATKNLDRSIPVKKTGLFGKIRGKIGGSVSKFARHVTASYTESRFVQRL